MHGLTKQVLLEKALMVISWELSIIIAYEGDMIRADRVLYDLKHNHIAAEEL